MKRNLKPIEWAGIALFAVAFAVGSVVYSDYAQQRLAREAVRDVADAARMTGMAETSWPGRRSSLWCATLDRPDGLVAVVTRGSRLPFFEEVVEVAPAWVEPRTPREARMIEACRTAAG